MKINRTVILVSVVVIMVVSFFISCKKETGKEIAQETSDLSNSAIIQVYNASIPSAATDPRRNYVYVDNIPLTGAPITFGSFFPSSATGAAVASGSKQFLIKDTIGTSAQPQLTFTQTLNARSGYTIFMYDTFTTIKQKTVETIIEIPNDTTARVRFANFVYHPSAISGIDIFSTRRNANVVSNLLPTNVTPFMAYAAATNDTLYVTEAGNPSNRLDTLRPFNPTPKRSYTLIFRGRWRTNEIGNAANPRTLSVFANN